MSLVNLPIDLLETILDSIHDKSAEPTPESQQTFASLARTSKLFLPLARSYLYYRPIPPSWTLTAWRTALSLVSSLSTPLGELVFSLQGIVNFVAKIGNLEEPPASLPFQSQGYTKAFSLYFKILSCCPRLAFIEINCDSNKHLSKLLDALKNSTPTLKTVNFATSIFSGDPDITEAIVDEALKRLRQGNIDEVILRDVDNSELWGSPRGPVALRSFSVQYSIPSFLSFKPLLPKDSSSLSSISLENIMLSDSDLTWVLSYLPVTIRSWKFSVIARFGESHIGSFEYYLELIRNSLRPSQFARFTALTHVSLMSFCGPSLALLDTLNLSSPAIALLRFVNSYWVNPSFSPSTSFPIVDNSIPSLLDSGALLSTLLKFYKLKSAHLGYLPTRKRETFRQLDEEMKEKRGVKVEWDVCY
ncbi:hypothetical protein JCM5350_005539 [Sporobolomyces pararoseus]